MLNQAAQAAEANLVGELAAKTRSGYSLDQQFYCDDAIFDADMREVVAAKWIVAGHVDQIRRKGDYFLFKIGRESIIVIRSDESTVNAFYNVCRHRGSVICTEPSGRAARLTCPYHAWSYGLDGALLAARLMPADFSKVDNGLNRCHVRVFYGLHFHQSIRRSSDRFRPDIRRSRRPTSTSMAWPTRRLHTGSPIPPTPIGNSSSRISSSAITVRRRTRNSAPCIRRRR